MGKTNKHLTPNFQIKVGDIFTQQYYFQYKNNPKLLINYID